MSNCWGTQFVAEPRYNYFLASGRHFSLWISSEGKLEEEDEEEEKENEKKRELVDWNTYTKKKQAGRWIEEKVEREKRKRERKREN